MAEYTIRDFPDFKEVISLKGNEKRIDWMHFVTHVLAISVIVVFLFLVCYKIVVQPNVSLPDYFVSIVSVIVGFYFARSLPFFKK